MLIVCFPDLGGINKGTVIHPVGCFNSLIEFILLLSPCWGGAYIANSIISPLLILIICNFLRLEISPF